MTSQADETFVRELRRALRRYYEPTKLARSLLVKCFDLGHQEDTSQALRRILREGIDSLRPDPSTPRQTEEWLLHQVLLQRFVQQFPQIVVADDLGMSERQLRRVEKAAVSKLAECLWKRYELGPRWRRGQATSLPGADAVDSTTVGMPSQEQELEWLRTSLGSEQVEIQTVIRGVLETIRPLLQASEVVVECHLPPDTLCVIAETAVVRQALLSAVAAAIRAVPGGKVCIEVESLHERLCVQVAPVGLAIRRSPVRDDDASGLDAARRLVSAFGGSLEVMPDGDARHPFIARLTLPTAERVAVLVIDDNPDTLRLIRRYLSGSRYSFVGTLDSRQAIALAQEARPRLIVLDVMLPHVDGWELLGRLREHPQVRGVPIIVCSMLRDEALALALGAATFIPKPVRRRTLLSALDDQLDRLSRGCG